MSITKVSGRQTPLVAEITLGYADFASDAGVVEAAFDIPANARVIGGDVVVDEVFNSTTSDVIDIGDGVDPNEYTASPISIAALGRTALTITGYKYVEADTIDIAWTAGVTGTANQGSLRIQLHYTIEDRATENQ